MSKYHSRCMDHPRFHHWKKHHSNKSSAANKWNYPPVNVHEFDDKYELYVYASGYEKKDFSINIVEDALVISAKQEGSSENDPTWRRREFSAGGFERRFGLPDGIDKDNIQAKYVKGILEIVLPKLSGFETVRQSISID